jgi:hypothetical protein
MDLSKHPHAVYKGQDEEAVRVQVCLRGKLDREHYCVNLRIPKSKLKSLYSGRTADEPYKPPADD